MATEKSTHPNATKVNGVPSKKPPGSARATVAAAKKERQHGKRPAAGSAAPKVADGRAPAGEKPDSKAARLAELEEKHLRLMAEYENHIKRTSKEKQDLVTYGGTEVIQKLLPVLDDLRRTVAHTRQLIARKDDPVVRGMQLVLDKFTRALEAEGVEVINSVGEQFDPHLHEALMSRESKDGPAGIVLEEFEPGYRYRDRVIRHAKVVVSG